MDSNLIRSELEAARQFDEQARQHKQQAATLIHRAVAEIGKDNVARAIGTDTRKVELLLNMAPVKPERRY